MRVLALDQRLGPVEVRGDQGQEVRRAPRSPKTATLEVTPREAEIIALARDMGSLSLALNSVRDGGDDDPPRTAGPKFDIAAQSLPPRRLTRESDVTSTTKIQVIRGRTIGAATTPDAAAPEAAPDPAPAAE